MQPAAADQDPTHDEMTAACGTKRSSIRPCTARIYTAQPRTTRNIAPRHRRLDVHYFLRQVVVGRECYGHAVLPSHSQPLSPVQDSN